MNVFSFIRQYADEIGGQFTDYDHTKAVVVIPLEPGRFQTVVVTIKPSHLSGREIAVFTSKVCEYDYALNPVNLLQENSQFDYSKFMIEDGYLKIEASATANTIAEEQVKEMLQEVAFMADKFEHTFTGMDVH